MIVTTAGIAMEIPMAGISRILVASCSLHTEYTAMLCRIDRDVSNTHYQPGGMASGNEFKSASLSTGETHMNSYGYNSGQTNNSTTISVLLSLGSIVYSLSKETHWIRIRQKDPDIDAWSMC